MKLGTFAFVAGSLALGLAALITPGKAQGPLWDVVHVNLPYTVSLADKTLQPGEYTIQQLRDNGGGSRVLLIYSDNGMKFETSAMTIPTLDPDTARDTKVTLHHVGNDYYFDKVWIQGKDYGYEFPLPSGVKAREKEQVAAVSVPANYSTMPAKTDESASAATNATTDAAATAATSSTTSSAATSATTGAATTSAAATSATTAQNTTPPVTTTPTTQPQTSTATATTAQSTVPAATTPSTTPPASSSNSADRAVEEQTPATTPATTPSSMPSTSAGWLMMLLGGGSLSGMGLALRRKR